MRVRIPGRGLAQRLIGHRAHGAKRMILWDSLFGTHVAEHSQLLLVISKPACF